MTDRRSWNDKVNPYPLYLIFFSEILTQFYPIYTGRSSDLRTGKKIRR